MPTVPQFGREVSPQNTPTPYRSVSLSPSAFGADVAQATNNLSKSLGDITINAADMFKRIEDTKNIEFTNFHHDWEQRNLYDKDNGYFYKLGKDAYGKSKELLQKYDKEMTDYINNAGFSAEGKQRALYTLGKMRERVQYHVNAHDYNQGKEWSKNETALKVNNLLTDAYNYRNDEETLKKVLDTGYQALEWEGEISHFDRTAIDLSKQKYTEDFHSAVLSGMIEDNSLKAKEYLEDNKQFLSPDKIRTFQSAINKMETKYNSNAYTAQILSTAKTEEEALSMVDDIKDEDVRDYVKSKVTSKFATDRRLYEQNQKELSQQFNSTVLAKQNSGEPLSYEDIPEGLDADTELSFREYIDKVNKGEEVETDNQLYEELLDLRYNNAQEFLNTDLYKYRGFLKESDFRHFLTEQEKLKQTDYHVNIKEKDLKDKIESAIKTSKIKWTHDKTQNVWMSETKGLVRELELRRGRKATDEEIDSIIASLGYKDKDGVYLYKKYEEGMAKRAGFLRDVINDITYYQNKHNGNFPEDNELSLILNKRLEQEVKKEQTKAQQLIQNFTSNANYYSKIYSVTPKENEQKVTTYFADVEAPAMSKRLGFNVRITSRYRDGKGSHHGEGRAVDVGMAKETREQRIKIYEELVKLPYVKAIGTSDTNILAHFNGNKKIVDERAYDKKHKTNHVNHAHVTFFWDNEIAAQEQKSTNIAAKNGVYSL